MPRRGAEDPAIQGYSLGEERQVSCLCIDVIGSTAAGLAMDGWLRKRYFQAVAEQLRPYLEAFELCDAIVKFTGDGWMIMQPGEKALRQLAALGKTLGRRFQRDIAQQLGKRAPLLPGIRASLFTGFDVAIAVPLGCSDSTRRLDWMGDSARLAQRYNVCCEENGLLADYVAFRALGLEFAFKLIALDALPSERQPKRQEEDIACYSVGDLNPDLAERIQGELAQVYKYYATYLNLTGEIAQADQLAQSIHTAVQSDIALQHDRPAASTATERKELRKTLVNLLAVTQPGETREAVLTSLERTGNKLHTGTYNSLLSGAGSYEAAVEWYKTMLSKEVPPDAFTFNTLVRVAPDFDAAIGWYKEMLSRGVAPDAFTFNTLLSRAPDYQTAVTWYQAMGRQGVEPDTFTLSILVHRSPDYVTVLGWYDVICALRLELDAVALNTLIHRSPDYGTAETWYVTMRQRGITPDVVTFGTLANRAPGYATAAYWYREMVAQDVKPNVVMFNTLIHRSPDYRQAVGWYEEMREQGVAPTAVTFGTLAKSSPDYETASHWYQLLLEQGLKPNPVVLNILIDRAPDYSKAVGWYKVMLEAGVRPDAYSFNALAKQSPDHSTAITWYQEMLDQKAKPDLVALRTLVRISPDCDAAVDWYERLVARGVGSDAQALRTLLARTSDYGATRRLYEMLLRLGVKPGITVFRALLRRAPDYDTALAVHDTMLKHEVEPDAVAFSALVSRAPDYDTAKVWYEAMLKQGIRPPEPASTALVDKVRDLQTALVVTEYVSRAGGFIGGGYFSAVFSKNVGAASGKDLLAIYHDLPYKHERCLEPAIKSYLDAGRLEDALDLCLFAPHLPAAIRVYRLHPEEATTWLRLVLAGDAHHVNAVYALGICLFTAGKHREAAPYLEKARAAAYSDARVKHVDAMLERIRTAQTGPG